ncbi:MAG: BrnT family toxin [Acidobacteriia bacterium]|nr:BrnT family toxin [Terriglobia bacterium]
MRFAWDENKSRLNRKKHGISFALAKEVFTDPFCLTIPDLTVQREERLWTIGRLENLVIVVVVHTTRDEHGEEVTRIISARKATPRERTYYEEADQ